MSYKGSLLLPLESEAVPSHVLAHHQGVTYIPGYDVECEIGCGGMATVYRAVQQSLGRRVAIKSLSPELSRDREFVERFQREGRILAQLSHPHIITIYDIGLSQDNHLFLSIEYLSGGTLKNRIREGLSIESVLHIVKAIAGALSFAHQKGVIHRDIKSSNIMFRHNGDPVLTDFGVARSAETRTVYTATGFIVGSPGYMSPEQAKGEGATTQADLYGLGVVLYEMLVGTLPYPADSPLAILFRHLNDPIPELPSQYRHLQPILNKLLAKTVVDRYQSADELLQALDSTSTNQPFILTAASLGVDQTHHPIHGQSLPSEQKVLKGQDDPDAYRLPPPRLASAQSRNEKRLDQPASHKRRSFLIGIVSIATLTITAGYYFYSQQEAAPLPGNSSERSTAPAQHAVEKPREHLAEQNLKQPEWERRQLNLQAQQLLLNAQLAFQENALQVSLAHIERGLMAAPDHAELLALREQVMARIAEQQRRAEQRRQQEEAQRQAEQRRQQEEAQRQAETARKRQQEEAQRQAAQRRQQEEAQRQAAQRRQQEEAQRQAEAARKRQQEEAQRQAEAARKRQQEETQRQAEAARQHQQERRTQATRSSATRNEDEDALKKIQDIRNAVNKLDKLLD